jgi:hypothetical protein
MLLVLWPLCHVVGIRARECASTPALYTLFLLQEESNEAEQKEESDNGNDDEGNNVALSECFASVFLSLIWSRLTLCMAGEGASDGVDVRWDVHD